jgi:hypothetical protein
MSYVHITTTLATAIATIRATGTTAASNGSVAALVTARSGRTTTRRRQRWWGRQVCWMVQPDLRSGQSLRPTGLLGLLVLR